MGVIASDQGLTDCKFGCDCGRYVELWNLVFMQFDRDASGKLNPLPKPSVDTGMGLERVTAVLQGVISNYDTDLFMPLMKRAAELCGVDLNREEKLEEGKGGAASLRVIADHFRAATFLVADGVVPSNEGRGYVLRKILRRAFSHANYLNPQRFFVSAGMTEIVRDLFGKAYPELLANVRGTSNILAVEEDRFLRITANGLKKLDETLAHSLDKKAKDELAGTGAVRSTTPRLSGRDAFYLYDTFGLPRDFIEDATRDRNVIVDWPEFEQAMAEQRARARASWKGGAKEAPNPAYAKLAET